MIGVLLVRHAARRPLIRTVAGVGLGSAAVAVGLNRKSIVSLDSSSTPQTSEPKPDIPIPTGGIGQYKLSQVSQGSLAGFAVGLTVGLFSKVLVVVLGSVFIIIQVAARYGIDITRLLRLEKSFKRAVSLKRNGNALFKLSFALAFTMAAFVHF